MGQTRSDASQRMQILRAFDRCFSERFRQAAAGSNDSGNVPTEGDSFGR